MNQKDRNGPVNVLPEVEGHQILAFHKCLDMVRIATETSGIHEHDMIMAP